MTLQGLGFSIPLAHLLKRTILITSANPGCNVQLVFLLTPGYLSAFWLLLSVKHKNQKVILFGTFALLLQLNLSSASNLKGGLSVIWIR